MFFVVDFDQYRLGRPVVAIEHPTTKKLNEPGPMRVFVVVGSCVETYPTASVFHVLLKSIAFGLGVGGCVKHDNDIVFFQFLVWVF